MHLKLPVYVIVVISVHNYPKNPIRITFFGENLKISIFSAKICKIRFIVNRHCDVKRRATGTFMVSMERGDSYLSSGA